MFKQKSVVAAVMMRRATMTPMFASTLMRSSTTVRSRYEMLSPKGHSPQPLLPRSNKQILQVKNAFTGNPVDGLALLKQLIANSASPFKPPHSLLKQLFESCYSSHHFVEMVEVFEIMKMYYPKDFIQTSYFNSIMRALCSMKNYSSAYQMYILLANSSIPAMRPNNETLSLILTALVAANMNVKALELFRLNLHKQQVKPLVKDYTVVISIYTRNAQMHDALILLDRMIRVSVKPNKYTYNLLIKGFYDLLDVKMHRKRTYRPYPKVIETKRPVIKDPAVSQLYQLLESGTNPIGLALRVFQMQQSHFEETKDPSVELDIKSYNTLLDALVENNMMSEAENLMKTIVGKHLTPTPVTMNIMMKGFLAEDDVEKAEAILQTSTVNVDSFNALMSYYLKELKAETSTTISCVNNILKCYKSMVYQQEIAPNTVTCSLLIEMYFLMNLPQNAIDLFLEMDEPKCESEDDDTFLVHLIEPVPRNEITYMLMIFYLPDQAQKYFQQLLQERIQPTIEVINAMTQALPTSGAFALWEQVKINFPGVSPNLKTLALFLLKDDCPSLREVEKSLGFDGEVQLTTVLTHLLEIDERTLWKYLWKQFGTDDYNET